MFCIEYIRDSNDFIVFFKIIEKEYVNNFLKHSQVYFGLLEDYRTKEAKGQHNIGDSYEATIGVFDKSSEEFIQAMRGMADRDIMNFSEL